MANGMTRQCALCKNHEPFGDFLVPSGTYPWIDEQGTQFDSPQLYDHPHCPKCRAVLESYGIYQGSPYQRGSHAG